VHLAVRISGYFTNKFTVVHPVRRVVLDHSLKRERSPKNAGQRR
jgi:hypothetical protein